MLPHSNNTMYYVMLHVESVVELHHEIELDRLFAVIFRMPETASYSFDHFTLSFQKRKKSSVGDSIFHKIWQRKRLYSGITTNFAEGLE